ncbi:MAG: hypothetical protein FWF05_03975 [Oscillospiraceae bacterium]|nr:hypothetical protein [Oscillospiraceae bacterium]
MKIAFINGSPRKSKSVSSFLLKSLQEKLPGCEISDGWAGPFDAIVFAFPLYVDGIPSTLLRELAAHERGLPAGARAYALVNNGFYEGKQNAVAITILRNWCARAGLEWGQGVGVGAGGMLQTVSVPVGRGPLKSLGRALDALAQNILTLGSGGDIFTSPNFPRRLYMIAAEIKFRMTVRKNGLKRRDVDRRLEE